MNKIFFFIAISAMQGFTLFSQKSNVQVKITDSKNNESLIGATLYFKSLETGGVSDVEGNIFLKDIAFGVHTARISFIGYQTIDTLLQILSPAEYFTFSMQEQDMDLEEVTISATRSSRTVQRIPTRVEFIGGEELEEKALMNATNISMVLRESTGIRIQQTSLSSGNNSVRIQGLDGRYTQLLKDGFPLYGGFSGGLSIMQIPPLDLAQFEVIKGANSTLYGGGAIAGLVNMVSKTPKEERELELMLTGTQAGGQTFNAFTSNRKGKIGYTMYGSANNQMAYDPDGDDFSNIPKTRSIAINPKLFYYPTEQTTLQVGVNSSFDKREGGDMNKINNDAGGVHQFFETNTSDRLSYTGILDHQINDSASFQLKNSIGYFNREINTPNLLFAGKQINSFTEASYSMLKKKSDWIFGLNLYTDDFKEDNMDLNRDQQNLTAGAFVNNTFDLGEKFVLESGFRVDQARDWGAFFLPRVSLLYAPSQKFSSRIGGGLGYKTPDLFTDEATTLNFYHVLPINKDALNAERSIGGNIDFNYQTALWDKVSLSVNQLFYLTSLQNSLLLMGDSTAYAFENAPKPIQSLGAETNIKLGYKDFKCFLNYAFIQTELTYLAGSPQKPLTPKHNAGMILMYETEDWRVGYELYYTGKQFLSDRSQTSDYSTMGLLVQKMTGFGSLYVNFENFTDVRQSRFTSVVLPPHNNPTFTELFAPTDGFIFSFGIIWKPFGAKEQHH